MSKINIQFAKDGLVFSGKKVILFLLLLGGGVFLFSSIIKADTLPADLAKSGKFLLELKDAKQLWFFEPAAKTKIFLGQTSTGESGTNLTALVKDKKINQKTLKKYSVNLNKLTGTDSDKDGLINILEDVLGTNKNKVDTNSNGYNDKSELLNIYDPVGQGKIQTYLAKNASNSLASKLAEQKKIKSFKDVGELKKFLNSNRYNSSMNYGYNSRGMVLENMADVALPSASKQAGSQTGISDSAPSDYSRTNVQVEGVDEGDIVKSDGKYIYAIAQNKLNIIKSFPADQSEIVNKIEFDSQPNGLYIDGNYLVVYGNDYSFRQQSIFKQFRRRSNYTFIKVYDLSDKSNPKMVRDLKFEGQYSNSRLIGSYLYFVTSYYNFAINYDFVLPKIIENGKVISSESNTSRYRFPSVYYFGVPYDNFNFNTVSAINIRSNSQPVKTEVYLMPNNQNMYVSEKNIYLTYTKHVSEYDIVMPVLKEIIMSRLDQSDQDYINKLEQTDDIILSPAEKQQKISLVLESFIESLSDEEQEIIRKSWEERIKQKYQDIGKELEKTVIHKIAIAGDSLKYQGSGEVPGQALNQFSLDEQGDYFRIATTRSRTWSNFADISSTESSNNLYVLNKDLKLVGTLENLAPGERIYSVRFMNNRAYMVTFRNTDPLFVIDLSDSNNPKVLGMLKIPGFSDYLHPYDETTLIGIGKQTDDSSGSVRVKGLKLSLFDVSQVDQPREISTYELGGRGSDSLALHDHKAFLFSRDKKLLVIPVYLTKETSDNSWGELEFSGAAVFNIDKSGFSLRGKISHTELSLKSGRDWYGYYGNEVKRSLYIENNLYTLSGNMLKVNNLSDLSEVKKILFNVVDQPIIVE